MAVPNGKSPTTPDMSDPDPDGDVVLIVTPPKQPPEYSRPETPSSTAVQNAAPTESTPLAEASPPDGKDCAEGLEQNHSPARRFKVSSRHLVLASEYFNSRLKSCWSEGEALRKKRNVELEITDANPEAVLILLNAIHGHLRRVPKVVNLNLLVELAVLVDYFQCHEILDLFSDLWVEALRSSVPSDYTNDVPRWIFISWVFRKADIFKQVTEVAQHQVTGELCTLQLPIPAALKSQIDACRIDALEAVISALYSRVELLKGAEIFCDFNCDSLQLGAMLKHMTAKGLDPRPGPGFFKFSFDSVAQAISEFNPLKCNRDIFCGHRYSSTKVNWEYIRDESNRKSQWLKGLDLHRYP